MTEVENATDVLIVGGGPVGLFLAIELGQRGVRCILAEQNERLGAQPRAKTTNVRSMEHLRRWGLADELRRRSPLPADYPSNVVFATRLDGYKLAVFENALNCARDKDERFSESAQWVPQYTVESVLRDCAASLPTVTLRHGCRLEDLEQSADGVRGELVDVASGERSTVTAQYLVGADGARSKVREKLGIALEGQYGFGRNVNVIFRAPGLAGHLASNPAIMYWLINGDTPAVVGPMDKGDTWFCVSTALPENLDTSQIDVCGMIRRCTGLTEDPEILAVDPWLSHKLVASRYGEGRVWLAGDACHLHPPFGGYGMNMGIADASGLGWALAALIQGWGGPELLTAYGTERRAVAEYVVDEAVKNYAAVTNSFVRDGLEDATEEGETLRRELGAVILERKAAEFYSLGVVLGYRYEGSPIVVPDGSTPPERIGTRYTPSAHPGCLAPHLWLADGASLYDRFGRGFTLLVTEGGETDDSRRLAEAAVRRGVPIAVLIPGDDRLPGLYRARYALIRPDQHVAWRGDRVPDDAEGLVDRVRGAV